MIAVVAGLTMFSLSACGSADSMSGARASEIKACLVSDENGLFDQGLNQSSYEGLLLAESNLGVEIATIESTSAEDYAANLEEMVQSECNVIIGVGSAMAEVVSEVAEANPEIYFGLVDATFATAQNNGQGLLFNTAEAAYLAGYLAAGVTSSGIVGTFIGTYTSAEMLLADGFIEGVAYYNEVHGSSVEVLGWDKDSQTGLSTGSLADQAAASELTRTLMAQGADVILPVAGEASLGALSVVKAAGDGTLVIWTGTDGYESTSGYEEILLTSVVKEASSAVYFLVDSVVNVTFLDLPYVGTLANDGVALADYHDLAERVSEDLQAEIEELKEAIISGEIVVESDNVPAEDD